MIEPGDIINNRYHILQELGDGGFGKTFEVKDSFTNDHKVMKILTQYRPKLFELFAQECDVLRKLNHPGIPHVQVDGYTIFGCPHTQEILHGLVMEKIAGQDLGKWLEQNNKIANTKQALEWLEQLIHILSHVHAQNYLHRDIKPGNIMLKPDSQLVLIDFGIVKEFIQKTQKQTIPATIVGTPGYNSPEQEAGNQVDYTSDFFSLGRTFLHLLTGIYPGYDNFLKDARGRLLWQDKAPEISEEFKNLIDYLMDNNRKGRPQNTQEILQIIQRIKDGEKKVIFPMPIIFFSVALNFLFLTLLAMGVTLDIGLKVLFVVVLCVISGFLVFPWIKYLS
ncbi:serine/threonine-protein kinase [Aphanizomenon sp. CS-733/32]|uniref:serine/threonine protein kinase n=1 Tax=Aphanizomenon sp. CS-733/32 TaxID=3021715 RepID=UPI00232DD1DB|nr:serine/threonine-protein kinase [Aphanizomenon sp. CS-733/32]MDB9311443.1 serine/threonine-protein kinase [Aphanizomenon sp. CS-733/32]